MVAVFLNTTAPGATAPTFAPQQAFPAGSLLASVAVGDFNGDGKPDLAVVNRGGSTSVLLNTWVPITVAPSFAPQQAFAAGSGPVSVAVGDFNGDGKPDLAVANFNSATVSVLLNTTPPGATAPSFAPQLTFPAGSIPWSVVVGDFNGEGRPDLAVANRGSNTVSVLLNTTAVGSTTPSFAPQQTFDTGFNPWSVAAGDFNGDGKPDLVVANFDSATVSVLLNTTAAGATTPSFAPQRTFATGSNPQSVAVGDFNGDGKPDLAVANSGSNTVSVLLNTTAPGATTPNFTPQQTFPTGLGPDSVAVGDFNGDGKPDLVVANFGSSTLSVLLNMTAPGATAPAFAPQQTFPTGLGPLSVAVGDFNGDDKPDLAVTNSLSGTVSVLSNTTAAGATAPSFAPQQTFSAGSRPESVAVGDFNGDGKPDLAVANRDSHTASVLLNNVAAIALSGSSATGTISSLNQAPVTVAAVAGSTPQSAIVATAFAMPLAVDVRDAAGTLVQGVSVIFTAPDSGPGGTFGDSTAVVVVTDASGRATAPTFTANTIASSSSYLVTAQAVGGSNPSASFRLTNLPAAASSLTLTGLPATLVAGTSNTATVTLRDRFNNIATGYTGTVAFASTDFNSTALRLM
jgi:hypothetical protein